MKSIIFRRILALMLIFTFYSCEKDEELVSLESNENISVAQANDLLVDADKNILDETDGVNVSNLFRKKSIARHCENDFVSSIETVYDSNCHPLMYVVNYGDNGGFTIVSATKNYLPIVAYSESGSFDLKKMEENAPDYWDICKSTIAEADAIFADSIKERYRMQWIRYERIPEINSDSRALSDAEVEKLKKEQIAIWQAKGYTCREFSAITYLLPEYDANSIIEDICHHTDPEYDCMETTILLNKSLNGWVHHVEPLLSTTWGQGYPFNLQVANGYPAGCVATAMAQIMNYHQWPLRYNWANMNTSCPNVIASFFKEIGTSVHMSYGTDGSFASNQNAYNAFINNYSYGAQLVNHTDNKVYENLEKGLPVYMAGDDGKVGHAWVCDGVQIYQYGEEVSVIMLFVANPSRGLHNEPYYYVARINTYTSDYYHMNWGWNGSNDGWFANSNISYKNNRKDIIDIAPAR